MIEYIIAWVAAVIFVEATVEIEVNSELFAGFRGRIIGIRWVGWYLNGLFSCGYCLSVWVSAVAALFVPGDIITVSAFASLSKLTSGDLPFVIADYLFKIFVIHRLANIWHEVVYRWLERMPFVLAFKRAETNKNVIDLEEDYGEERTGSETEDNS
jgi:hypothetical protein